MQLLARVACALEYLPLATLMGASCAEHSFFGIDGRFFRLRRASRASRSSRGDVDLVFGRLLCLHEPSGHVDRVRGSGRCSRAGAALDDAAAPVEHNFVLAQQILFAQLVQEPLSCFVIGLGQDLVDDKLTQLLVCIGRAQERIDIVREPTADSLELAVPAAFGEPLVLDDASCLLVKVILRRIPLQHQQPQLYELESCRSIVVAVTRVVLRSKDLPKPWVSVHHRVREEREQLIVLISPIGLSLQFDLLVVPFALFDFTHPRLVGRLISEGRPLGEWVRFLDGTRGPDRREDAGRDLALGNVSEPARRQHRLCLAPPVPCVVWSRYASREWIQRFRIRRVLSLS